MVAAASCPLRLCSLVVKRSASCPNSQRVAATETPKHMTKVNSFRDLEVYKVAFNVQQEIYGLSKRWPREENFALTDQIRRSSRSIGANLAESWGKRRYPAHFLSKLTDSDGELQETIHWLDTALACKHITPVEHGKLMDNLAQIGRLLGSMINRHESFCF